MSLTWGKDETTITTSAPAGLQRGDSITFSGLACNDAGMNGKVFVVRRAKGTQYLVSPAGWLDYVKHYAKKFGNWVQWHYYGVVDALCERVRCLFS